jgi:uroporphyrinogen-III synthase
MRVIVTRPAAQAATWADELRARGIDAVALPLIGIGPVANRDAVTQAWLSLAARSLVVFVSPNAVEEFFAARPEALVWPESTVAASVGPGTTHALVRHSVPEGCIAEPAADSVQFDSESLWQRLSRDNWSGKSVLIVRGDGGRDWLADTLRSNGAVVTFVAAYRRLMPEFCGVERDLLAHAIANPAGHLWFFSSSEAISNLVAAEPHAKWTASRAIATHPRIAQRARGCGFGVVAESPPTLEGVMACIQSVAS